MGRMLEALRRREAKARVPQLESPIGPINPPQIDSSVGEHAEPCGRAVPYIEVGIGATTTNHGEANHVNSETEVGGSVEWMTVRFQPVPVARDAEHGRCHFASELIAFHDPDHPASRQYEELARNLLLHLPSDDAKVFLLTSVGRDCGTTTVLLNSALTLARASERRVVVVDGCLRHPSLAQRLGLPPAPGLSEALEGRVAPEDGLQQTGVANLRAMTAGTAEPSSLHPLANERMRILLDRLRESADLVLLDGPAWDGRPELLALGSACDAVYLCARERHSDADATAELASLLPEQGVPLRGCILTGR